jgi:hypothetical protein
MLDVASIVINTCASFLNHGSGDMCKSFRRNVDDDISDICSQLYNVSWSFGTCAFQENPQEIEAC